MPTLAQITNTFFVSLITRLGVRPPPAEGFLLSNIVQPVTLVDSDISLSAVLTTQILGAPVSGSQAAPAVNTVIADAGALAAAGTYQFTFFLATEGETGNREMVIARRNAANAADVWAASIVAAAGGLAPFNLTMTMGVSERVVVRMGSGLAATGGSNYHASIFTTGPV